MRVLGVPRVPRGLRSKEGRNIKKFVICCIWLPILAARIDLRAGQAGAASVPSIRLDVPIVKQPYNMCMSACVSMVLQYWGHEIPPAAIIERIPIYKDGATGRDLLEFVESIGWRGFLIQPRLEDLFQHLSRKRPLIVALPGREKLRHAMVLVGYDDSSVWLNDPATGKMQQLSIETFEKKWQETHHWTFLIVPK